MSSPPSRSRSHSRVKVKEEPRSRSRSVEKERDRFQDYDGPREKRRRDEDYDGPRHSHKKRQDDDYEGPRNRRKPDGDYEGPRHRSGRDNDDHDRPRRHNRQDFDYDGPRIKKEPEDDDRPRGSTDNRYKPRDSEPSRSDSRNERYDRSSRDHRNEKYDPSRTNRDRRDDERGDSDRNREYNGRKRDPAREKDWNNFFKNVEIKPERPESEKYGVQTDKDESAPPVEKEKPNFGLSGKLTEETNTFKGVVIKYSEPPEARKPQKIRWRLYPFKANEELPVMFIHRQSAYLLGRDRKIADIPIDHPSCSKQHAVIQYRLQPYTRADGTKGRRVKPYIIDLESANGTLVNEVKIDPKRYVELFEKDVLKFGFSSREYVLLHEHSKDEPDDDEPEAPVSPLPDVKKEKDELD